MGQKGRVYRGVGAFLSFGSTIDQAAAMGKIENSGNMLQSLEIITIDRHSRFDFGALINLLPIMLKIGGKLLKKYLEYYVVQD